MKKTALARARQKEGVRALRKLFAFGRKGSLMREFVLATGADQSGRGRPVRLRPGVPVLRDAEHREKHLRRKAAKAARRRNRKA